MPNQKILTIFGTRPEAIKLAPIILKLKTENSIESIICSTGQHKEMLNQVLEIFSMKSDIDLNLMKPNQSLAALSISGLKHISEVLNEFKPDLLLVQGDTTTAFISALAAYYLKVNVGHVEAGLRSYNLNSPYPEEANRRFISIIAKYHFAPTGIAYNNLINEGVLPQHVYVTGNTVVDALEGAKKRMSLMEKEIEESFYRLLNKSFFDKEFVLITLHRREKFGSEFAELFHTLKELSTENPDINFIYPVHLNPNVSLPVKEILGDVKNIFLTPPLDYLKFLFLMSKCSFIMTDSGGIQEECYVFSKPVMVLRDVTERMEAIDAGYGFLVGSNSSNVKRVFYEIKEKLLESYNFFSSKNPFGDGKAAERIIDILKSENL
ncbi:MAG: UDP-N-acetylglucosamine 2-epimerase [Ignavibacteria bacterium CG2_30_36_16]|nr:UDP-N-acetylglucosamine 2-epimerase (non-hydrolyzing) [Ignavibacteria bacterium]OIP56093.1 MAG: UDP-N-acetylglucosamine 2-epimerase [Ignavibacteria bacterium CG2_30_36_16]PIQ08335.1 MAG: UDP-N-acetylglucosamine 2-epimerase (non-hydrolyzing) [Ignavibacteriales bacterium CG18_big_fil_WC_8_21_14_2_50_31_20]PJA99487.1 MAG: UDP-N-acetylglucosamine 2-epimerase (non-hydrolyzing) [Ignavibacteria bacterium CG_4_9_14_3_um_filter_36_18]